MLNMGQDGHETWIFTKALAELGVEAKMPSLEAVYSLRWRQLSKFVAAGPPSSGDDRWQVKEKEGANQITEISAQKFHFH